MIIIQEAPDGFRSPNDCTRIWRDGRVEQPGWPRVKIHYRSGTRIPTGRHHRGHRRLPAAAALRRGVESCRCRSTSGGGYGGDADWLHGVWKGEKFTERLTYDMTDPAIIGRSGFGVIDHVGRAVMPRRRQDPRRAGACSSTARWAGMTQSGFADWLTVAP